MGISFPEKSESEEKIRNFLFSLEDGVTPYTPRSLHRYSTNPHPLALEMVCRFSKYNQSNAGTHTRDLYSKIRPLLSLEREVIFMLGDLLGSSDIDGYLTQGGTEGNIMGLWIGRNLLRRINPSSKKICLIKTSQSHFSIDKAANILDIQKVVDVDLDSKFQMSVSGLQKTLKRLADDGYENFLVLLTVGYPVTGTSDQIQELDVIIENGKKELGINTFVHIDAATGGLIHPFSSQKPIGFLNSCVDSITLDMHKTGFVPFTAGVFLCKKGLQRYVQRPISYLPRGLDDTVSSSRPATTAVACWVVLKSLGREGFNSVVEDELLLKKYFISLLEKCNSKPRSLIISDPAMNMVAFNVPKFGRRNPIFMRRKYGLHQTPIIIEGREERVYTIIFMPHITKKVFVELFIDIENENIL